MREVTPQAIELRRLLHEHPEPSHQEHRTTALVATALDENGVAYHERKPATGLWLDVGSQPTVAFRADLDALPIIEPADNVPVSLIPGWMHACGHDAHASIAFGVAVVLTRLQTDGFRVLFQPAEETFPGGATDLVAEGLVDGLKAIIAFHVDPSLAPGRVGARVGPITASADKLSIVLEGPGGHTARPHQTVDLIADAARVIHELPAAMRRSVDPRSPFIMAFGSIHGGEAGNVIPTRVAIEGTVRTLDSSLWGALPELIDDALGSLLAVSGASYTLRYSQAIPPVINDSAVVETASRALADGLGPEVVVPVEASMGGEDFSNYLERVPGALFRLGSGGFVGDLHSPAFRLDEAAIGFGIEAAITALLGLRSSH